MVDYFADRFQKKFKCDLRESPRGIRTLRSACERAKRTISKGTNASILCEALYQGHDFQDIISCAMFENLNDELFRSCMGLVAQVLKDAKLSKSDVTDIVVVGGSSRIPRVQQLLQEFFKNFSRIFQEFFKNSSMVNNHVVVLIQMKPLHMEQQFKQLF
jgi:L1 cell adhesion molecule like protein